jgi:hypothetical protein
MSDRYRCPVCGKGTLVDISHDATDGDAEPIQTADSKQVQTFSCGHEVKSDSLAGADEERLEVERRSSPDADPEPETGSD